MTSLPSISIVVPSYNQGRFLTETLQSLVDQEYPNLQVVIQDGCSTDDSVPIAEDFVRRFPGIFQLHVEKDAGQADAINRGFARATGSILGFLNSDDTLFPGVLHRVSAEIDPARNRYVVMGRSLFTGENSKYVGVEHPAEYISHFEQLAIWKRGYNTIPQPSVFWHKDVTDKVGWLDVNEHHALDYDLFCRFSRYYRFQRIDELFSTYRMHDDSKSSQRSEAEVLALSIGVSRKHWGRWISPLRWRLELSHWMYTHHFHDHARHHARRAEQAFRERRFASAIINFLQTAWYSPRMARDRLLYGWAAGRVPGLLGRMVARDTAFHGQHPDGWIGPSFVSQIEVPAHATALHCLLEHVPQPGHDGFTVNLAVEGNITGHAVASVPGVFELCAEVAEWRGKPITIQVASGHHFVPSEVLGVNDDRQLSLKFHGIEFR